MKRNRKGMAFFIVVIIALIAVKAIWVSCSINGIGSFETEKKDIIRRANYLTSKVATTPQKLLEEMPSGIGEQFQGEWAIYSCFQSSSLEKSSILRCLRKLKNTTECVGGKTQWMVYMAIVAIYPITVMWHG